MMATKRKPAKKSATRAVVRDGWAAVSWKSPIAPGWRIDVEPLVGTYDVWRYDAEQGRTVFVSRHATLAAAKKAVG